MARRSNVVSAATLLIPPQPTLEGLREAVQACRACSLWERGTQAVFGEGSQGARIMLVGEQPGDREDLAGRPFVGPAGHLLDKALMEAGIHRVDVYVTNVVKHFKWTAKGKRRMHDKPDASEIQACMPWLQAELAAVRPRIIVALGATAAQAVLGKSFRLTQHRGEFVPSPLAPYVTATVHPSAVLRSPDDLTRHLETRRFVQDLRLVAGILEREREQRAA